MITKRIKEDVTTEIPSLSRKLAAIPLINAKYILRIRVFYPQKRVSDRFSDPHPT